MKKATAAGVAALLALTLVGVPLLLRDSSYWMTVGINIFLLAFISLGVWLTFSIGRINIGQGAFALVGGYAVAILTVKLGWPISVSLVLAGLISGALSALVGSVILRLRGVYFSMLTLCFTEVARLLVLNWKDLTQGASGIVDIPSPFQGEAAYLQAYYFSAGLLIFGFMVIWRISRCRIGGVFRTIRADEGLASSIGIPVARYRVLAYTIAGVFGGIGGAAMTLVLQSIYPTSFTVTSSTNFMLYCFLGGLHSVAGPLVGAGVLFLGFQVLSGLGAYQSFVYAALIVVAMIVLPNGLLSLGQGNKLGRTQRQKPTRQGRTS